MPDFDPQRPRATREPNRPNRLRSVLMANWLRTAWIGVGILVLVMVVIPGGLLIYQSSRRETIHQQTVTCDERYLDVGHTCIPPAGGGKVACDAESRDLVEKHGYCQKGAKNEPYWLGKTVTCERYSRGADSTVSPSASAAIGECYPPTRKPYLICNANARRLVNEDTYCKSSNRVINPATH